MENGSVVRDWNGALQCRADREIDGYLDSKIRVGPSQNPLNWWKQNWRQYSSIAPTVRKWLCVPANSTPSERDFPIAAWLEQLSVQI